MEDFYEINVAKKIMERSHHYCKVMLPPTTTEAEAKEKLEELKQIFGEDYALDLLYWECVGHHIQEVLTGCKETYTYIYKVRR